MPVEILDEAMALPLQPAGPEGRFGGGPPQGRLPPSPDVAAPPGALEVHLVDAFVGGLHQKELVACVEHLHAEEVVAELPAHLSEDVVVPWPELLGLADEGHDPVHEPTPGGDDPGALSLGEATPAHGGEVADAEAQRRLGVAHPGP